MIAARATKLPGSSGGVTGRYQRAITDARARGKPRDKQAAVDAMARDAGDTQPRLWPRAFLDETMAIALGASQEFRKRYWRARLDAWGVMPADLAQIAWEAVAAGVYHYDRYRGPFAPFAFQRARWALMALSASGGLVRTPPQSEGDEAAAARDSRSYVPFEGSEAAEEAGEDEDLPAMLVGLDAGRLWDSTPLTERERFVLSERTSFPGGTGYRCRGLTLKEVTLKELGSEMGVTQERVRQIYLMGLAKLRFFPQDLPGAKCLSDLRRDSDAWLLDLT